MKQNNNKKKYKYDLGSFVQDQKAFSGIAQPAGQLGTMLGGAIGGSTGGVISGIASGAGMGAALGPIGAGVGALIGGAGALLGNRKQARAKAQLEETNRLNYANAYKDNFNSNMDTSNDNPYGLVFADGGIVKPSVQDNTKVNKTKIIKPTAKVDKKVLDLYKQYYGDQSTEALKSMIINNGNPTINNNKGFGTASYNPLNNTISGNLSSKTNNAYTDEFIASNNKDKIIAELAHAKQFSNGIINPSAQWLTNDLPAYMKGNNPYNIPGTLEHDAHNVIEPSLNKQLEEQSFNNVQPSALSKIVNKKMAYGGIIPDVTKINIEQGELQIDPATGKILRDYTGINPETGGMYKPHSKGKDTANNFVTADPGTFIITKKLAKDYKDSVDNNDKLRKNTILQNIKNYKDEVQPAAKFATGGGIPYQSAQNPAYDPMAFLNSLASPQLGPVNPVTGLNQSPPRTATLSGNFTNPYLTPSGAFTRPTQSESSGFDASGALNTAMNYAPSLINIGQGLFGNVEQTTQAQRNINPYKSQILNNLPQDVNISPLLDRINRGQDTQFNRIDQQTSSSPIARANKTNVFANTQDKIGDLYMQQSQANNQIRGQRAGIYSNLGAQDMQEQSRVQQLNLGIDESNRANRAAKGNLLNTGLSQLQQVYQNQKLNKSKQSIDKYKVDLMKQMFPNLKYYGGTFGEDALAKLISG